MLPSKALGGVALRYDARMVTHRISSLAPCKACQDRPPLTLEFSMAFQPIIDVRSREVFAYEALVRGLDGSGAAHILGQVNDDNRCTAAAALKPRLTTLARATRA